jgi:hypothetical protein
MDAYERKARLYPAFCVAFPLTLLGLFLFTLPAWWQPLVALAAAGGLHVLVVQVVRDLGTGKQSQLWASWGGPPTTQELRWKGKTNSIAHERRHRDVESATGIELPSRADEEAQAFEADATYKAATDILREKTRGGGFPLVRAEVANYGYRRNLYGCRVFGIAVAAGVAIAEVVLGILGARGQIGVSPELMVLAAAISLVFLLLWVTLVTPTFVKRAADRYAEALMAAAGSVSAAGS